MYKLTKHAIKQAKSRLGWNESTLQRMVPKIMSDGIKHNQTKGSLKKFMDHTYTKYGDANNMRIYGEDLFIFSGNTLITLYRIPNKLINNLKYLRNE